MSGAGFSYDLGELCPGLVTLGESLELENSTQVGGSPKVGKGKGSTM